MKTIVTACMLTLLAGCVSQQLKNTSVADLNAAIAITQNPDFPNPTLGKCLQAYLSFAQSVPTSGGGIATTIAEKEAFDMVSAIPECIIIKAKINAFFAKFGVVIPVAP
jgi:hypothetical protein